MDKEDLLQWKDHPVTQWVLNQCKAQATQWAEETKERLFQSAQHPAGWAELQAPASYLKGLADGVTYFHQVEVEEPDA
jgi:hypothetical protein